MHSAEVMVVATVVAVFMEAEGSTVRRMSAAVFTGPVAPAAAGPGGRCAPGRVASPADLPLPGPQGAAGNIKTAEMGWTGRLAGILSGYPVLPVEIAKRLGGSKYGRTRTSRNPPRRHEL